jgi:hypothetical protein
MRAAQLHGSSAAATTRLRADSAARGFMPEEPFAAHHLTLTLSVYQAQQKASHLSRVEIWSAERPLCAS